MNRLIDHGESGERNKKAMRLTLREDPGSETMVREALTRT